MSRVCIRVDETINGVAELQLRWLGYLYSSDWLDIWISLVCCVPASQRAAVRMDAI